MTTLYPQDFEITSTMHTHAAYQAAQRAMRHPWTAFLAQGQQAHADQVDADSFVVKALIEGLADPQADDHPGFLDRQTDVCLTHRVRELCRLARRTRPQAILTRLQADGSDFVAEAPSAEVMPWFVAFVVYGRFVAGARTRSKSVAQTIAAAWADAWRAGTMGAHLGQGRRTAPGSASTAYKVKGNGRTLGSIAVMKFEVS